MEDNQRKFTVDLDFNLTFIAFYLYCVCFHSIVLLDSNKTRAIFKRKGRKLQEILFKSSYTSGKVMDEKIDTI